MYLHNYYSGIEQPGSSPDSLSGGREFKSHSRYSSIQKKFKIKKEGFIIKQISKQEIQKLLSKGIIKNTNRGYVNRNGYEVGYYKTSGGKRYLQDKYVDMLGKIK